jgi:hypothetical protein
MKKKFSFSKNAPKVQNLDPTTVGEYLYKHFPKGDFIPKEVVDLARDPKSPIHSYFQWDDKKASELYRIGEARRLIGCLFVQVETGDKVRAYESVKLSVQSNASYMNTADIAEIPYLQDQVLETAKRELNIWASKYRRYEAYFQLVFDFIETNIKGETNENEENVGNKKRSAGSRSVDKNPADRT